MTAAIGPKITTTEAQLNDLKAHCLAERLVGSIALLILRTEKEGDKGVSRTKAFLDGKLEVTVPLYTHTVYNCRDCGCMGRLLSDNYVIKNVAKDIFFEFDSLTLHTMMAHRNFISLDIARACKVLELS